MKLLDQIGLVFEDAGAAKLEAALLHACIALDGTAKRLYPSELSGRRRFVRAIRDYYWLVEPMMGVGVNLVDTQFSNVTLENGNSAPDFAELIYRIHRCNHAHGDEVPVEYALIGSDGPSLSSWELAPNSVRMPDRVIWALAAISVFAHVNHRLMGQGGGLYLSWGTQRYFLAEWWGRENDLRSIASGWNTTRVELQELQRMRSADPVTGEEMELMIIARPPSPPPN